MEIHLIWAQDNNGGIGLNGKLPWHISEDLKNFKKITSNSTIIMGRKTWDSLPIKPLPNRENIVMSSDNIKNVISFNSYERCVERGAQNIIICPFFLSRGKHWKEDIPSLANNAAKKFPHTKYHVALPLGVDSLILDLLDKRIGGVPESAFKLPA